MARLNGGSRHVFLAHRQAIGHRSLSDSLGESWLWDAATGQCVHHPDEPGLRHTSAINALGAVEHAGRTLLLTASSDRTVCLWDPATATRVMEIPVRHVALGVAWFEELLVVGLDRGLQALTLKLPS